MRRSMAVCLALVGAVAGCAKGAGTGTAELEGGLYELATVGLEASCPLEGGITEGQQYVGKVASVDVTVTSGTVRLEACDPFFDDVATCFATTGEALSLIREGEELFAADPHWLVPGCGCWDDFAGERRVDGFVMAEDAAELVWTFEVPPAPENCWCEGWSGCTATVQQRLTRR